MAALTVEFPQTVWTVEFGGDEIVVAPVTMAPGAPGGGGGGGAVDSVNGQTGTVVLDAGDVGAVPVSRTITAGAGLTGGGDLSADRTLAQATATASIAVSAVDGTATTFHVIVPSPGAAAAAPIPAGWVDGGAGALPVSLLTAGGIVVRSGNSALGEPFGLYRIPAGGASTPWESLPLAIGQVIGVGTFGSTVMAGTVTGAGVEAITPDTRIDGVDARIDGVDARIDGVDARIDGVDARIAVHALGSELAEDITTAFRGDGTVDAHWTTPPLTASFTTGICVRALRIPRRPATIPFFAEVFSQTHDSGAGAWDNMEMADLWTDDTYAEDGGSTEDGELRGFWEQTESGGSTDGSGWWPDLCATSDVAVETMVDITFATSTGRMWVRVPHDLDDGGTYHVEADGAVFRLQSTLISAKFASIDNPAGELWRLGERYSGDIVAVTVRDGLGGTLIANPNASLVSPGATSFVDGAGNTWTAGPTASVVDLTAVATHTHSAADITSGTVATARLGSGTADNTTFLRGDQTWAAPAGGGGGESGYPLISNARQSDTGRFFGTVLCGHRINNTTIPADRMALGAQRLSAGTITDLALNVSVALAAGEKIDILCYANAGDDLPGALQWAQEKTVGTSTGDITLSGLSLSIPTTGLWFFAVYNRAGNSGSLVTLGADSSLVLSAAANNFAASGYYLRPNLGAYPTDLSTYTVQSSSGVGTLMWTNYAPWLAARGTVT